MLDRCFKKCNNVRDDSSSMDVETISEITCELRRCEVLSRKKKLWFYEVVQSVLNRGLAKDKKINSAGGRNGRPKRSFPWSSETNDR